MVKPRHGHDEIRLGWADREVIAVDRKHPGKDCPARSMAHLAERPNEAFSIPVIEDGRFTPVAAGHRVVDGAFALISRSARHDRGKNPEGRRVEILSCLSFS